jgi:GAF domain-containing protein
MPIEPAHLARSLGALDTVDVAQGLARTLQQVLRSAKTLLDADRAGLMLVDQAGALRWASASDQIAEAGEGDLDRLAQGPCTTAFAQRAPAAVPDLSAEPGRRTLAQVGVEDGNHAALSVPVQVGGGPVGTLDVHVTAPREWDDSQVAALQAYAGLVASLLAAAGTARVRGRLADQLQGALEHRLLIEQAEAVVITREGLDGQAAFEWLRTAARSAGCAVVEVAGEVLGGAPLPSDRLAQAKAHRHEATDQEVAVHRRDSELHEDAARRYERRGQADPARTEHLQAAAARGRIIDAEAERRRADQAP